MKIIVNDDINMIIFLNKIYLNQIDFEDKEKLENMGWKIINLLDAADMDTASLFGGDNE